MLNDTVARRGVVRVGLEHATLCAVEAAYSTASGGCAAWGGERGCLAVSWVGGDRVCTRRGRRAVCGFGRGWRSGTRSARLAEARARRSWVLWLVSSRQGWSRGG